MPEKRIEYMRYKVARRKAGELASDFLLLTNERPESIRIVLYINCVT